MATKTVTKAKNAASTKSATASATKRSKQVLDQIRKANKEVEGAHLTMAKLLHEAYTKEYAGAWGYEDFEAFCTAEVGAGYRKARYMVDIWAKISERKLPVAQLTKIGWSKLKEITSVMSESFNVNDEDLVKMAGEMSLRELTEEIKEIRQKAGNSRNPSQFKVSFILSSSGNSAVAEAVETAIGIQENDDKGLALEMICQDWLLEKGKVPEKQDLKGFIEYLEKMYGITISYKKVAGKAAAVDEEAATPTTGKGKGKAKKATAKKQAAAKKAAPKKAAKKKAPAETDDDLDDLLSDDDVGDVDPDGDEDLTDLFDEEGGDDSEAELDELLGLGDD